MTNGKGINYKVLLIFAPVLILTGIAGFLVPEDVNLMSGAPAFNIFHIVFGVIGLFLLFLRNENYIRFFNIGFGLIDLYQAVAAFTNLFPIRHFQWTRVDDFLHLVIGAFLVAVGIYGYKTQN